jgi:pyrroloquinoline-quinone synthase
MIDTVRGLDAAAKRWNLLEHSFYQRWSAGTLTREELADYAGQYTHVVAGLPRWLEAAAQADPDFGDELRRHSREEERHISLWDRFTAAVSEGEVVPAEPNLATSDLVRRCDELAASGQGVAVAWAIEAQTPAVSIAKLEGLRQHYAIDERSGGQYFELHRELDVEHEIELRTVIASQPEVIAADAPEAASAVLEGLWQLLSSVERPTTAV